MSDIALFWDPITFQGHMAVKNGDMDTDPQRELATAVITSIFSWARSGGEKGWWGDSWPNVANDQWGSTLWTLRREKLTQQTLNRAKQIVENSLAWMIEDQVATRVEVQVTRRNIVGIDIVVIIHRFSGEIVPLRFESQWEAMINA